VLQDASINEWLIANVKEGHGLNLGYQVSHYSIVPTEVVQCQLLSRREGIPYDQWHFLLAWFAETIYALGLEEALGGVAVGSGGQWCFDLVGGPASIMVVSQT